jgi:hypothetical protein
VKAGGKSARFFIECRERERERERERRFLFHIAPVYWPGDTPLARRGLCCGLYLETEAEQGGVRGAPATDADDMENIDWNHKMA